MSRKRKKLKEQHSFRKKRVGSIKGHVKGLSEAIANGVIADKDIIYNSIMDIVIECCEFGHEQCYSEKRSFRDKRVKAEKEAFDELLTEIDDKVNENK